MHCQTFGDLVNFHPHVHVLAADGVFRADGAFGIGLRIAGLRLAHPDWPDEQLEREARRSLLYAGT